MLEDDAMVGKLMEEAKSETPKDEDGESYHRGLSTNLDVRRLNDEIKIAEGEEITHEQIEEIIHESRDTNRYRTVVGKWRKGIMDGQNILLVPRSGVGYLVAMPRERIVVADGLRKQAARRIWKAADIAIKTDKSRLTPNERRQVEFITMTKSRLELAEAVQSMGQQAG